MMKKTWIDRKDEEGEMGVGTLLIFIAMILVAAVAATVLVSTAYKLQQQAESTGDEALADVATGVKTLAVWGETDVSSLIDDIYIKIALTAGSPGINIENMVIEVTKTISAGFYGEITLNWTTGTTPTANEYVIEPLRDMPPTTTGAMMTSGDIFQVHFQLSLLRTGDLRLNPQDSINVLFIPKHGVPTAISIVAPSTMEATSVVLL